MSLPVSLMVIPLSQLFAQNKYNLQLENFLGDQFFITRQLWEGRGGTSIVIAHDGTVMTLPCCLPMQMRVSILVLFHADRWSKKQCVLHGY